MRKPWRAPGSRYGACDIDSMPPPTATSRSPARTAWSIIPTARTLDAQTLLIVSEVTSIGIPASICAWRLGICPWAAWSTVPITTCCDLLGRDVGALQRLADRDAAEMRGRERRQTPAQLADRRARAAQDHGSRHTASRLTCGRCTSQRPRTPRLPRAPTRSSSASSRTRGSPTITAASCRRWSTPARPSGRCASSRSRTPRASATSSPGWARARASIPSGRGSPPPGSCRARRSSGPKALCWEVPHHVSDAHVGALVEGTLLAAYSYREFKGSDDDAGGLDALLALGPPRRERARRAGRHGRRRDQPRPRPPEPPGERAHADRAGRVRPGARGRRGRGHGRRGDRGRGHGRVRLRRAGLLRGRAADHAALRAGRRHRPAARASSARR